MNLHVGLISQEIGIANDGEDGEHEHQHYLLSIFYSVAHSAKTNPQLAQNEVEGQHDYLDGEVALWIWQSCQFEYVYKQGANTEEAHIDLIEVE